MMTTYIVDDKKHKIVTQQYEIGMYYIVDNDPAKQGGFNCKEIDFHKSLRRTYRYIPEESTNLD